MDLFEAIKKGDSRFVLASIRESSGLEKGGDRL